MAYEKVCGLWELLGGKCKPKAETDAFKNGIAIEIERQDEESPKPPEDSKPPELPKSPEDSKSSEKSQSQPEDVCIVKIESCNDNCFDKQKKQPYAGIDVWGPCYNMCSDNYYTCTGETRR